MKTIIIFLFSLFLLSCKESAPLPKPRSYPKVDYPEKAYKLFSQSSCPMQCEIPVYSIVENDSTFFDGRPRSDCWFNIKFPDFNGLIFCSYIPITHRDSLTKCIRDAYKLAQQHQQKANYVDEIPIRKPNHVSGIVFNLEGASASPFQFYLTDSSKHFLRGSLYFNTKTRPDSIAPIAEFIKQDIIHMMNTFEWKN
ncbi:MAG TPA: hypothetical protein PK622_01060 [Saprospiraceae bacterium]|jgi:gliding motility-associated lipoprotein GldD|nr:hypothetical protein [Saprospiraceae bacterium]HUN15364.1 hypothetical protein [Saprospiraceae bacterium]